MRSAKRYSDSHKFSDLSQILQGHRSTCFFYKKIVNCVSFMHFEIKAYFKAYVTCYGLQVSPI